MRPRAWMFLLALSLAAGLSFPYAELAWKCREPLTSSESCVWARSYFPLSRWIEPLIIAPLLFVVLMVIATIRERRSQRGSSGA